MFAKSTGRRSGSGHAGSECASCPVDKLRIICWSTAGFVPTFAPLRIFTFRMNHLLYTICLSGRSEGAGRASGMTRCQQLFAKEKSLTPTFRSIEKPLVVTREARTSKIVLNPIEEQNPGSFSIPHFNCGMQSADQRSDAF